MGIKQIKKQSNKLFSEISKYGVVEEEKMLAVFYGIACVLADKREVYIPRVGTLNLSKRSFKPDVSFLADSDMALFRGELVEFFIEEIKRKIKK